MPLERLTVEDMSDREFLLIMADVADADGWSDSLRVANQLGLHQRKMASSRLSWLARYGAVEREHERDEGGNLRYHRDGRVRFTQRWRMTKVGEALAFGHLTKRQADQLERLDDARMLEVTHWLTDRSRQAGFTVQKLMAREWRYGTSKLRSSNGRVS